MTQMNVDRLRLAMPLTILIVLLSSVVTMTVYMTRLIMKVDAIPVLMQEHIKGDWCVIHEASAVRDMEKNNPQFKGPDVFAIKRRQNE